MAGFREHVTVSGVCGACYAGFAVWFGHFTAVQGALAGCLVWFAGMLPDLDSKPGRPLREVFTWLAAAAPFLVLRRLLDWAANDAELTILLGIGLYTTIRYGGPIVLSRLSVHRGMFHSLPALFIAAEGVFLAYKTDDLRVRMLLATGAGVGFLSHLLLDEFYSMRWDGLGVSLNRAAGTAVKLLGRGLFANLFVYSLLSVMTYASLVEAGILPDPYADELPPPQLRQATEEPPTRG